LGKKLLTSSRGDFDRGGDHKASSAFEFGRVGNFRIERGDDNVTSGRVLGNKEFNAGPSGIEIRFDDLSDEFISIGG
jgi:hypothetical protein